MRASAVVKCQLALACLASRWCSQAAISSISVPLSAMRRLRHCEVRTPSSDSPSSTAVLGGVVPFEALRQAARFGGRKGFVKRSLAVDIEIVMDQNDHGGAGKAMIGQLFQHMSIIDRGMAVGDFDMAPAFEGGEHHE